MFIESILSVEFEFWRDWQDVQECDKWFIGINLHLCYIYGTRIELSTIFVSWCKLCIFFAIQG